MIATSAALSHLAQQLAQKQTELETLRQAYDAQLASLQQRKQELELNLQAVVAEIDAATQPKTPPATATAASPTPATKSVAPKASKTPKISATPAPKPPATTSAQTPALPAVLMGIFQERALPLTVRELTDEVKRRNYASTSSNLEKMVRNRVEAMLRKGTLNKRQSKDGMKLFPATSTPKASPAKVATPKKAATNGKTSTNGTHASHQANPVKKSLKAVLTDLLGKSPKPLKAKELAEKALAAGYQTKSKTFIDVVWTALGGMDNLENIAGQGYRLKKGQAKKK